MKRFVVHIPLILILFLLIGLHGCDLLPLSIVDRIASFENDINNDRTKAYLNFDSNSTDWYIGIQGSGFWEQPFTVSKLPYAITVVNSTNPLNVVCTITGAIGYTFGPQIIFKMVQVGSGWFIEEIPSMENYTFGKVVD